VNDIDINSEEISEVLEEEGRRIRELEMDYADFANRTLEALDQFLSLRAKASEAKWKRKILLSLLASKGKFPASAS